MSEPTTVECCGEARSTPFCPQCGKGLVPDLPLVSLLQYITGQAERLQKRAQGANCRPADHGKFGPVAAKWETWRLELSAAIKHLQEEE